MSTFPSLRAGAQVQLFLAFHGVHASAPPLIYFFVSSANSAPPISSSYDTSNSSSHRRPTSAHHAVDCSVRSHSPGLRHISPLPRLRHRCHPLRVPQHRRDLVDQELHHPRRPFIMIYSHDDRPPSPLPVPSPVVLRIVPKVGSSAPIRYIYSPDPSCDGGDGGLLAASAAFFAHPLPQPRGLLSGWENHGAHRRCGSSSGPHPLRGP